MRLTKIELENFRNYQQAQVSINSDLVLILGENAAGKTNFLESIYYISMLKSFRGPDAVLVSYDQNHFRITADSARGRYETAVQINPTVKKNYKLDDVKVPKTRWKSFAVVLFVPPDLNLFTLGPILRRRLLDDTIGQVKKDYSLDLVSLEHVLKQRSALLAKIQKQGASAEELGIWNQQLAELAVRIGLAREEFITFINAQFNPFYQELTGFRSDFKFLYHKSAETTEEFLSHLDRFQANEIKTGLNLWGPHREDWIINKDGVLNVYNSSRGELRSQVLALKLLQADYLNKFGSPPVILLDDVFSELDETRRAKLLEQASSYQILITSTEERHLPPIARSVQTLRVLDNRIV